MRKLTLQEMKDIANARDGECLSEKYTNNREKLTWRCQQGHIWPANANGIKRGTWCPQCEGNIRLTIEEMHSIANKRGGRCLSLEYVNSKTPMQWECSQLHTWTAVPADVKSGKWCDACARKISADKRRGDIKEMHRIAAQYGGVCLSETYTNSQSSMRWRCSEGHEWTNCANNVKRGQWCGICRKKQAGVKRRDTIEAMQQIAKSRGGICLSKEYLGSGKALDWQCEKGHQWQAAPTNIKSAESWCPKCGYESSANLRKKDIQIMHNVAKSRGGLCLSTVHESVHKKLLWRCAHNHEWLATPAKILKGRWCSLCSDYLGERICREYLEQIFKHRFPKARPDWLLNFKGNRAELDGYCVELNLAFEHHGQYHYQVDKLYSKTNQQVKKRQEEDRYKELVCSDNGVRVIVIPEVFTLTPLENIQSVIEDECLRMQIELPSDFYSIIIDLKNAYSSTYADTALQELNEIALERGGKCLSHVYERAVSKMKWQCKSEHIFEASPNSIRNGSWCLECSGRKPLSIEEMRLIAKTRGGECLSEVYINAHAKLRWQCGVGHVWEANANSVKHQGTWCRRCARKTTQS